VYGSIEGNLAVAIDMQVGTVEVSGSNPLVPTISSKHLPPSKF
jgi:hypothetical protein